MTHQLSSSERRRSLDWKTRLWAVIKYELLWSIRKKKLAGLLLVAVAFALAGLIFPGLLSPLSDINANANVRPDFALGLSVGKLGFFFFALIVAMNIFSGEFESGTIVPLITKPVSRTTVFLGKLFAALLTVLVVYGVFFACGTVGGIIAYGPQNNLQLVPVAFLGDVLTTFFWVALVMAFGSLSRSTILTVLAAFSLFIAFSVGLPLAVPSGIQTAPELNFLPGNGATGTTYVNITFTSYNPKTNQTMNMTAEWAKSMPTGTDYITVNLINFFLHPVGNVSFINVTDSHVDTMPGQVKHNDVLYTEPNGLIPLRAIAVDVIYTAVILAVAWYAFKRVQVSE